MKLNALLIALAFPATIALASGCGGEGNHASHSGTDMKAKTAHKTVEIAQKTCPVMKGKIDPKVLVEYAGRKIYFCCPGCEKQFAQDPKKYIKIVDEEIKKEGA